MSGPVVYRMYDADEKLLYIGRSTAALTRFATHGSLSPWWDEVDVITVEHFGTLPEARKAEAEAIARECPEYNLTHSTMGRERRLVRRQAREEVGAALRSEIARRSLPEPEPAAS